MKLGYLFPVDLRDDPREFAGRARDLARVAPPGVTIVPADTPGAPVSIESVAEEYLATPHVMRRIRELEADGCDAVVVSCFSDPGLPALREVAGVPVIGSGQASFLAAVAVGRRFSVVTVLEQTIGEIEDLVLREGFGPWLASVRAVEVPVLGLRAATEAIRRDMLAEARAAVLHDRADTVIWGCTGMGFVDLEWRLDRELARELGAAVVNPVTAPIGVAVGQWTAKLKPNRRAFPAPPKPVTV